jgi:long-chain fatty acid transport protein
VRDIGDPSLADDVLLAFDFDRAEQRFDLPRELRGGVWIAPYPELRFELDAALRDWSSLGDTDVPLGGGSRDPVVRREPRDWDDTLSLRLAAEGDLTDQWSVGGGVAWEPSPVAGAIEPGFPRADAMVYAVGGSYRLEAFTLDLGYSFHDFDERSATGQEVGIPELESRYSARDQVWSVSARWEF